MALPKETQEPTIKFEEPPLYEIAQAMIDWCLLERGCEYFGERDGEERLECPRCRSRKESGGIDKEAFSVNKDTAQFHCFHCNLDGQGLDGPRGLRTLLEGGGASSFSANSNAQKRTAEKRKATPPDSVEVSFSLEPVMSLKELLTAQRTGMLPEAEEYFKKRGFSGKDLRDIIAQGSIFTAPAGTQYSFMKYPLEKPAIFFPSFKDGKVVHVVYKLIGGGYYNSPGPKPIYLTRANPLNNTIVVVEGIFDALSVYVAGYQGAALLGETITSNHDLSIFGGKDVVVAMDGDEAGQKKVNENAEAIPPSALSVRIATIPLETTDGGNVKVKDPNDVHVHHGKDRLRELIENAVEIPKPAKPEATVEDAGEEASLPEPQPLDVQAQPSDETHLSLETFDGRDEAPDVPLTQPAPEAPPTGETTPELQSAQPVKEDSGIIASHSHEAPESQAPLAFPSATSRIVIPEICWRGIFRDFRQAHTGTTEAPDEFFFGSLLATAGAILGRSTFIQLGQRLYPNFYVALVGETAKSRKTTAARKATDLVECADPLVSRAFGLSTAEGLMLMFQESEAEAPVAPTWEGQRVFVWIDEFSGLLKKARTDFCAPLIEMLQRLYDNPDSVEIRTKIMPMTARKPSLSIITATTREKLTRYLTSEDIEGGFANRFSFFAGQRKPPIPRPNKPDEKHLENTVIIALHKARERWKHTEFTFDPDAAQVWDDFYNAEYYDVGEDEATLELTNRLTDQTAKLALIYAATENDEPVIHCDQIKASVAWATEYEKPMVKDLFAEYGMSEQVKLESRITEIARNGGVTKRDIFRRLHHVPTERFNRTFDNMLKAGTLATETMLVSSNDGKKRARTIYRAVK